MIDYILPVIALVMLSIFIYMAIKSRYKTKKFIFYITLGILVSTVLMILPVELEKARSTGILSPIRAILGALLYSLKALSGRQDVSQLDLIGLKGAAKEVYLMINYVCFFFAPISASSMILSFFGDFLDKIKLFFKFGKECHIFSNLNDNSITLAKTIKKNNKSAVLIFCDCKESNDLYVEEARSIGSVLLNKPCYSFKIPLRFKKKIYFYLLSIEEDKNINDVCRLLDSHNKTKKKLVVNIFAQDSVNIQNIESIVNGNANIKLRFIDEISMFCNNLLLEYPLYNYVNDQDSINVAIVGLGRTGIQMLKSVIWCGQIHGYKLRIRCFDKNAPKIRREFYAMCPGLNNTEYDIKFIKADVTYDDFESKLVNTEREDNAFFSYVIVSMKDDQMNLSTAVKMRGIFRRTRKTFDLYPPIFARVRTSMKQSNLSNTNNNYLKSYNVIPFGDIGQIYSEKSLFNTKLEKLAFAVHLFYNKKTSEKVGSSEYKKQIDKFETSEYNRRSSTAAALHLYTKMFIFSKLKGVDLQKAPESFAEMLTKKDEKETKEILDILAQNEHKRWNAYMCSEGYISADIETVRLYAHDTNKNRDEKSKLHPCITSWENLPNVDKIVDELHLSDEKSDYRGNDVNIVKKMPEIFMLADQKTEE